MPPNASNQVQHLLLHLGSQIVLFRGEKTAKGIEWEEKQGGAKQWSVAKDTIVNCLWTPSPNKVLQLLHVLYNWGKYIKKYKKILILYSANVQNG